MYLIAVFSIIALISISTSIMVLYSSHRDNVKLLHSEIKLVEEEFASEMVGVESDELEQTYAGKQLLELLKQTEHLNRKDKGYWRQQREIARENERQIRQQIILARMYSSRSSLEEEVMEQEKYKVKR